VSDWYAPNQQAVGTEPATATAEPKKAAKKSTAKKSEEGDDE
jgi:hypothetical protein